MSEAKISIVADASEAIAAAGKTGQALEEVETSLDDVGLASQDASDLAVRSLGDIDTAADDTARNAETAAERLERSFRDSLDVVSKQAKETGKDAGKGLKDGVEESVQSDPPLNAGDVFKADLKAELASNAAEAGAEVARGLADGFDSEDLSTITDGLADTLVAVGAAGGPAGIAAGLAGASILEMFVGPLLAGAKEQAEAFAKTFSDAFDNIVEAGVEAGKEMTISASVAEFAKDADKFKKAAETAALLGTDPGIVLRAMAGDVDALGIVQAKYTESTDKETAARAEKNRKQAEGQKLTWEETADLDVLTAVNTDLRDNMQDVNTEYANQTGALSASEDAVKAYTAAQNFAAEKTIKTAEANALATGKTQELEVTIDGVTRAIEVMPDGKVIDVTDDGSSRLTQQEIDEISGSDVKVKVTADTSEFERQMSVVGNRVYRTTVVPRPGKPVAQ